MYGDVNEGDGGYLVVVVLGGELVLCSREPVYYRWVDEAWNSDTRAGRVLVDSSAARVEKPQDSGRGFVADCTISEDGQVVVCDPRIGVGSADQVLGVGVLVRTIHLDELLTRQVVPRIMIAVSAGPVEIFL